MRFRTLAVALGIAAIAVAGGYYALRAVVIARAEAQLMTPYPNGKATPAQFGASYAFFWIDSAGGRKLEASLVRAPSSCADKVAVLLYHGRGEAISSWAKAQAFLSRNCVSSIVFDYSGFGSSTPPAHIETLNEDAVAAYNAFVAKFPSGWRRCVLAHSMGNAPMLHAYPAMNPKPDCVVMANAFSSVEDMALAGGAPAPLAGFLHGTWDNARAIRAVRSPLMVVQSDADQTIPRIAATHLAEAAKAAPDGAAIVHLHGFDHNALIRNPNDAWWGAALAFLHGSNTSATAK